MGMCAHVPVCVRVHVYVEARESCPVSALASAGLNHCDSISHRTLSSLICLDGQASKSSDPPTSLPPRFWDYNPETPHAAVFLFVLRKGLGASSGLAVNLRFSCQEIPGFPGSRTVILF